MEPDVFKLTWSGRLGDTVCEVDWFFEADTSGSSDPFAVGTNLLNALSVSVLTALQFALPRNWVGTLTTTRRINNGGGPTAIRRWLLDGWPVNPYAHDAAICPYVTLNYLRPDRWRAHHFTIPAAWRGLSESNRISITQRNTIATVVLALQAGLAFGGNTFTHCVFDRSADRSFPILGYFITRNTRVVASRRRPIPA